MIRQFAWTTTVLSLFLSGYALCDEWSLKANVDQNLGYDDNVCMLPDNATGNVLCGQGRQRGSFKYMITPVLTFQHRTDTSNVSAHAIYGTQMYTDIPGFDQDFQSYGINSVYNTETIDWGLDWNYSITPTRNTAATESGRFDNRSDRNSWSISPTATFKLDEVNSFIVTPSYSETFFDKTAGDPGNNFFNDNKNYAINMAWQHLWSERFLSGVSFFYNRFESQIQVNDVDENGQPIVSTLPSAFDNFGINFANTYLISDNWKLTAVVGGRYTESEIGDERDTNIGFLADTSISYTGENFTAGLNFMRGLTPSTFGQLQEQTSVGLNFSYKVLEKLSTGLNFNYQESTTTGFVPNSFNNFGNRTNFVIEPSVSWQFARDWTLGGSYRYRFQDVDQQGGVIGLFAGEADSNLFMISINYNWQGISVSK
ncbi:hypothetical protein MCAMS1_01256 [biofilm metagenome]